MKLLLKSIKHKESKNTLQELMNLTSVAFLFIEQYLEQIVRNNYPTSTLIICIVHIVNSKFLNDTYMLLR